MIFLADGRLVGFTAGFKFSTALYHPLAACTCDELFDVTHSLTLRDVYKNVYIRTINSGKVYEQSRYLPVENWEVNYGIFL